MPDEELGIRVVSADEMEPASVIADMPEADEPASDADEPAPGIEPEWARGR
jgi:hypothetical protein